MRVLEFDIEDDYNLIGIHSSEEDYKIAYLLNKYIKTQFKKASYTLDFKNTNAEFDLFEYNNKIDFINFYLINNKYIQQVTSTENDSLFGGDYTSTTYLIPERKKIDYFIKIEGCNNINYINNLVKEINKIEQVITSFSIDANLLKSKYNLIF